jgi:lipopolysaccharide export system permease protein
VRRNIYFLGLRNRLYSINKFDTQTNTMEGITILEHDEHQNIAKKIVASKGTYKDGVWRFSRSITYTFDEYGQIRGNPQLLEEELMTITEKPKEFLDQGLTPDFMTTAQLDEYIWKLSKSGASKSVRELTVELYQRFTIPFTSLLIILLGIPFSLKIRKRAAGLSSFGISLVLGFLYYVVNAVCFALGKQGFFPPLIAVSLSHIIALLFSLYLILDLP